MHSYELLERRTTVPQPLRAHAGQTKPAASHAPNWLYAAIAFHVLCALVLGPVASHPYDLAVLAGTPEAWLKWGFSPFYNWKFGIDYTALTFLAQALRSFLASFGAPGIMALHVAWKLPLVSADLLAAGAIYRLALRLAPARATLLASLWLVNPVVLWVSAGHGQVESIAILSVFAALQLALDRRLFWAGVVTGLGVGVEYFPLAAAGSIFLWWRGGQLTGRRPFLVYCSGLALSLVLCFAPLLADPIGRPSLMGGLAFSGGFTSSFSGGFSSAPSVSLLTAWAWFDYRGDHFWPLVFGISGIGAFAVAWRYANRGPIVGLLFLGVVLLMAVLIDANALPQFALIAVAGLSLIALAVPVNPLIMIFIPAAGVATYLLFLDEGNSTANAFFYDDWAATGAKLFALSPNPGAALFLGRLFSMGLVLTIIYSIRRWRRRPWGSRRTRPSSLWSTGATLAGATMCLALVVWASQPAIWRSALSASPASNLPAFDSYVAARGGTMVRVGAESWKVNYSDTLIRASRLGVEQPLVGLEVAMGNLYDREGINAHRAASSWTELTATISEWQRVRPSIQSLWIQILIGSDSWTENSPPIASEIALQVNGVRVLAERAALVAKGPKAVGWAIVAFRVPAMLVDSNGDVELLPIPSSLLWNGSTEGPWLRILPASGTFTTLVDFVPTKSTFQLDDNGHGYAWGLPLRDTFLVSIDRSQLPSYQVQGAVLRWPDSPELWKNNSLFQGVGLTYGLAVMVATAWLMSRYSRAASVSRRVTPPAVVQSPGLDDGGWHRSA